MKESIIKIIKISLVLVLVFVSVLSFNYVVAASTCNGSTYICNPLGQTNDINGVLNLVLAGLQVIAGVLCVIFIILAGLKFVTANGNTKTIEEARKMLRYVIIGAAIIIGAQGISYVVQNTVNELKSGTTN